MYWSLMGILLGIFLVIIWIYLLTRKDFLTFLTEEPLKGSIIGKDIKIYLEYLNTKQDIEEMVVIRLLSVFAIIGFIIFIISYYLSWILLILLIWLVKTIIGNQ